MQLRIIHTTVLALFILLVAPYALAHGGLHTSTGLIDGFMHPASGLDHLLVAIAAGYWAARGGDHGVRDVLFFLALFAAGSLLGMLSFAIPQLPVVGAILFLLAVVVIAVAIGYNAWLGHAAFGSLAIYQGMSHLLLTPAHAGMGGFALGLLIATGVLMIFGMILRQVVVTRRPHAGHKSA
ncbi:MAG: HupE/UreJ family protein [Gammaproteobacteria bacterium]|nr:HupE/UreJ family protein [Gammaproteobacteria bacterium]